MEIKILKPRKALNKAFLKVKPSRIEIESFKANLIKLIGKIDEIEREENQKNHLRDFLRDTYYKDQHEINTKDTKDLVIHHGKSNKSDVGVIIEAKRPSNKTEMLKITDINKRAFHELLLYYLRERISEKNHNIKNLIISNIYEWYVFDERIFERLFAQNKNLIKQFQVFITSGKTTDVFYKEIAEPFISDIKNEIEFAYFDIRDYEKPLLNENKKDDNKLIALFKLLSPEHLLKLPFANDSNSLDKKFYGELLHLIGLTETKEGSKKIIERNKESLRNTGSFIENAIIQLNSLDKISRLENPNQFGSNNQERLFNVALELSITWINRILFLKLLEGQLRTYHKGDKSYEFLNSDRIQNYDDLNSLFFQVLARRFDERDEDIKDAFAKVPYLNSSLFEPTDIEHVTLFISNLRDDKTLPIYSQTVLKDDQGKRLTGELNTIEYLFRFLSAYDFASEGSEEIQEDNKTLINASVLGLIFEKINGYKDGSFFTPGFITMYMCRETIRKAVIQKFNETNGWNCTDLNSLYNKIEDSNEANRIINDLKICDPAVGSGHFLVSALNEIIAIKGDLQVLQDSDGRLLKKYHFEVVNDELIVTDEDGELFEYNPANKESQRIQETLFHEKQTIIENCLFGVDINPNSVKICRLRLWIELLKNAYYKNETELETLPNIDINIKCGNSLISRFTLDADLSKALRSIKYDIKTYRGFVNDYKNEKNKEVKRGLAKIISSIKNDFKSNIDTPFKSKLSKARAEVTNVLSELNRKQQWGEKLPKELKNKLETASENLAKLESKKEEILNNVIYTNAFEWRFEFPEVLDDNSNYIGFDVVIGNPPYMLLQTLPKHDETHLKSTFKTATYKGDTFGVFIEQANNLASTFGIINVIVPYTWTSIQQHFELRKLILDNDVNYIIDLPQKVFENADLDTTIVQMSKKKTKSDKFLIGKAENEKIFIYKTGSIDFCKQNDYWQINLNISETESEILSKVIDLSNPLESYFKVSQGYIPYRRSDLIKTFGAVEGNRIVDERLWHSNEALTPEFKQEIQGKDLSRFRYKESYQYIYYGKHLAGFVDPIYFKSPRVLVMEVTRGHRYKLTTTFVEKELYNTPSIINIIHPSSNIDELHFLTGLLNSSLITWYHLKVHSKAQAKTSIPKILVREVRNIPFPKIESKIKSNISFLASKASVSSASEIEEISLSIDKLVYELYDLSTTEIDIIEQSLK